MLFSPGWHSSRAAVLSSHAWHSGPGRDTEVRPPSPRPSSRIGVLREVTRDQPRASGCACAVLRRASAVTQSVFTKCRVRQPGRAILANWLCPANNVVTWYFYRLHTVLSYEILTILPLLYSTSLWLTYFETSSLYLLIHCTYIIPASDSSPVVTNSLFSVTVSLFLSCYFWSHFNFRFCLEVKTNCICLPLSDISLYQYYFTSVILYRFIHLLADGKGYSFLWMNNIILYMLCIYVCTNVLYKLHVKESCMAQGSLELKLPSRSSPPF